MLLPPARRRQQRQLAPVLQRAGAERLLEAFVAVVMTVTALRLLPV